MNKMTDPPDLLHHIDRRLDTIEELLKMNIAQSVVADLTKGQEGHQLFLLDRGVEIWNWLQENGFSCSRLFSFGDAVCLMLETEEKMNIRLIRQVRSAFLEQFPGYILVFCFQALNGATKRKMREENIAFCLDGKELYILR